jgi:hypothetical protein
VAISVLLYAGLALLAFGGVSLVYPPRFLGIATRVQALAIFAAGILAVAIALLAPVPAARRNTRGPTRLDAFVPEFQFAEFHERLVRATPETIDAAIRSVPAEEIRLFRLLTWIRNPRLSGKAAPETILSPPRKAPILDVATRSGFVLLSDEPGREIVLGTLVVHPRGVRLAVPNDPAETGRRFAALSEPGYAKAAMNFRIEPRPDGTCRLTTETRIFAADARTARRFARYWRFVFPGSALLRVTWLDAIAARAETVRG